METPEESLIDTILTPLVNPKDPIKADFRNFLYLVWKHLDLPDPTPVQYDIANYLQHGPRRFCIEAFRGIGKSWITSAFVCWLLYGNPQLKIMVVSASKERADQFSSFVKKLIDEMDILHHLQSRRGQRDSKLSFDVGPALADHSPSVKSVGITGQLSGSRADVIVADDLEVPNNSDTQVQREKLSELIKEFDAIIKPNGRICYLGTPQSEDSVYNKLPERGYTVRIWPARYPTEKQVESYGSKLAPFIIERLEKLLGRPGATTEPIRFSDIDLMEREASYGKAGFALQFMLDTSLSDADKYPLKIANIPVFDVNPELAPSKMIWTNNPKYGIEDVPNIAITGDRYYRPQWISDDWIPYECAVMSIDPSGRGKDRTGYSVVKMLHGRLYLTKVGGLKGGYDDDTLVNLAKIAAEQKVNYVVIEGNFGDGMFTKIFQPVLNKYHNATIEEVKHHTQKEKRIVDTLEPVLGQHRLVIDRQLILDDYSKEPENLHRFIYQLTRITRDRGSLVHDDIIDALSMAVAYFTERMIVSTDTAHSDYLEALKDIELEKFAESVLGRNSSINDTIWYNTPRL